MCLLTKVMEVYEVFADHIADRKRTHELLTVFQISCTYKFYLQCVFFYALQGGQFL